LFEVFQARVAAVRQQQLAGELMRRRQEVPFGVLVGSQVCFHDLILENADAGVQLDRRRADLGEAAPEGAGQAVVHGEGTTVLHDHVGEVSEVLRVRSPEHLLRQPAEDVEVDLPQEERELRLRQPVVERLVLSVQAGRRVEGAQDVGDGPDPQRPQSLHQGAHQTLRRDITQPAAVAALACPVHERLEPEHRLQGAGVSAKMAAVQRWPPFDRTSSSNRKNRRSPLSCLPAQRDNRTSDLFSMTYKILPMRRNKLHLTPNKGYSVNLPSRERPGGRRAA